MARPLYDRFFQWGYVTRDSAAAAALFTERFGHIDFMVLHNTSPSEMTRPMKNVCLAWIGKAMVELIEVDDAVPSIFADFLPASRGDMRLHHLAYFIDDFDATLKRLKSDGYDVPFIHRYGDVNDVLYADARTQCGHYLEFVRLGGEGLKWFEAVPGFVAMP
jgi:hypothetical protein